MKVSDQPTRIFARGSEWIVDNVRTFGKLCPRRNFSFSESGKLSTPSYMPSQWSTNRIRNVHALYFHLIFLGWIFGNVKSFESYNKTLDVSRCTQIYILIDALEEIQSNVLVQLRSEQPGKESKKNIEMENEIIEMKKMTEKIQQ